MDQRVPGPVPRFSRPCSRTISFLEENTVVTVVDRSAFSSPVETMNAPWYRVRLADELRDGSMAPM